MLSLTIYIGSSGGGLWKSSDAGITFKPVFDKQPSLSIGAVKIDPNDPNTVWVGTGESWTRNSVSIGTGLYRSKDGGETWQKMGLENTERIARIVINPKDSNNLYVCAPGHLWNSLLLTVSARLKSCPDYEPFLKHALSIAGNNLTMPSTLIVSERMVAG